jgi:hypothetical protein
MLSDSGGGDVTLIKPYTIREHKIVFQAIYKPQINYSEFDLDERVTK